MDSSSNFIRWCGIAAVVGGIVYLSLGLLGRLYIYLYSPSDPSGVPPILNFVERIFPILLLFGAAAAIAGLHRIQRRRYGLAGALASLAAFVGVVLLLVGSVVEAVAGPAFEPSLLFLISGLFLATLGLAGLGVLTILARVLPWWVGAALILGSPPFVLLLPTIFEGLVLPYETLHPLLAGVAWALVGYGLFRIAAHAGPRQPARGGFRDR